MKGKFGIMLSDGELLKVQIYRLILKFGHMKTFSFKDHFTELFPLIHMSGEDIFDKVKPYKNILEENLWDDLFQKSVIPNRQTLLTILPSRKILAPTLPSRVTDPFLSTVINEAHAVIRKLKRIL